MSNGKKKSKDDYGMYYYLNEYDWDEDEEEGGCKDYEGGACEDTDGEGDCDDDEDEVCVEEEEE